jgi:cytochrome c553
MTKDEYEEYRRSAHWRAVSRLMRSLEKVCEICAFPYELNVHHKTYERLGHEHPNDLIVLCRACHARTHFLDDIDSYPQFLLEGKAETIKRLEKQREDARKKNIERADEIRRNRERENDD